MPNNLSFTLCGIDMSFGVTEQPSFNRRRASLLPTTVSIPSHKAPKALRANYGLTIGDDVCIGISSDLAPADDDDDGDDREVDNDDADSDEFVDAQDDSDDDDCEDDFVDAEEDLQHAVMVV